MRFNSWLTSLHRNLATRRICSGVHRRRHFIAGSAMIELLEPRRLLSAATIVTSVELGTGAHVLHNGDEVTSSIAAVSVSFSNNLNAVSGGPNSVTNTSNWQLTQNGVNVSNPISGITFGLNASTQQYVAVVTFSQPLTDGVFQLTARQSIHDLSGLALDGDANGTVGGDFHCSFEVAEMLPQGPATQVNSFTTGSQFIPSIAMDAAGDYVVVWQSNPQQSSGLIGIYAQRYNAQGTAVGGEIHVNTSTMFSDTGPGVAMDAAGDFVVTWTSNREDGSRYGIYAQRFDASGNPEGAEFRVNTFTLFSQTGGSVAMDSAGDFVVTWQSYHQSGGNTQIYAQRYDASGTAVGGEFQVNTDTTQNHFAGSATMDAAGDFLITWRDQTTQGTFGQRFSADGTTLGSVIKFTSGLVGSSVAMDAAGDFVVIFDGYDGSSTGIFAQRYDSNGIAQGSLFQVNTYTTGAQKFAAVAIDATGDFVVTWQNYTDDQAFVAEGVHARRYDSTGTPQGGEFEVTEGSNNQFLLLPGVAMDSAGDFVVTSQGSVTSNRSDYNVYTQRYHADVAPVLSQIESATLFDNGQIAIPVTSTLQASDFDNVNLSGATIKITGNYQAGQDQLVIANTANITGSWNAAAGILTLTGIDSIANYQTALRSVQFVTTGTNTAARTISFKASDGQQGSNVVSRVIDLPPKVLSIAPLPANPSLPSAVQFRVTFSEPVGNVVAGDFSLVESGLAGGTVAFAGTDALYTLTISGLEGRGTLGVNLTNFGSIIDAGHNAVAQGITGSVLAVKNSGPTVLAVLAGTGSHQVQNGSELTSSMTAFSVAFSENLNAISGGANSVTNPSNWQLTRYGIDVSNQISGITFALDPTTHRYTAAVNFHQLLAAGVYQLVARQSIRDLAGSALNSDSNGVAGGDFRINVVIAETVPAGVETQVNTVTGGSQIQPQIAMDSRGDYVVVWSSYSHDGSGYGVYAQRYNSDGTANGSEFKVNTYTKGAQELASVAMDALGDFVITWQSFAQDGSGFGIYAQRYNSNGVAQGGEFQVNTFTTDAQSSPSVAMDTAGDFVIAWEIPASSGIHSGIYAQRYNSAGVTQGNNFKVDQSPPINGSWNVPHVAMDSTGEFVISWSNQVQRYNASGVALGSAITVSTQSSQSDVAMDAAGDFVVTWFNSAYGNGASDIYAQRYNSAGTAEGTFRVSDHTTYDERLPAIAMDAAGDFVVSWHSYGVNGLGLVHVGYYAKQYGSDGTPQGPEFRVDSSSGLTFSDPPAVAVDAAGDFVVAWKSASDGSGSGIYLHRYQADVAPLLGAIEFAPQNEVESLTVPVTSSLLVSDYDSTTLTGATIQVAVNFQSGKDILGFVGTFTPKITASWNAGTGTLTLSGKDSVSDYRTAFRNVTFQHLAGSPDSTLTRTISFQATDGLLSSNVVSRNVTIIGLPTLSGANSTATYTSNTGPVSIAPNLVAADPDSLNLVSATITFSNWLVEDRLSFNNVFGLQSVVTHNLAAQTISLTITGSDTIANYQTLLRSIKYSDSSAAPTAGVRAGTILVNDGVFSSNTENVNVVVVAGSVTSASKSA